MTEKEKKILFRKIRFWISIGIIGLVFILFVFPLFLGKVVSPAIKELKTAIEKNPNDPVALERFILGAIREQERYNFKDRKKNKDIIALAIVEAKRYLETINSNNSSVQLALARLYFQNAGIANKSGEIARSTRAVQQGLALFNTLSKTKENDIIFRLYRAINLSNLPSIFEQETQSLNDFSFVAEKILTSDFDIEKEVTKLYYRGVLLVGLELGVAFAKKFNGNETLLTNALEKAKSLFPDIETDLKRTVTVDMLQLE